MMLSPFKSYLDNSSKPSLVIVFLLYELIDKLEPNSSDELSIAPLLSLSYTSNPSPYSIQEVLF